MFIYCILFCSPHQKKYRKNMYKDTKSTSMCYSKYVTPTTSNKHHQEKDSCKQYTTLARIFNINAPKYFGQGQKVSIVGLDDIGMAIVYTLLAKGITNNICMIDMNEDILKGEHMDLQSSALYLNNARLQASKDPEETRESKVCVITTGTYKGRDETDHDYISRSAGIIRAIVAPLSKHSPDAIFIVASDPVDILSHVTWRLTGLPKQRIIGTGTLVDSARFQYLLSNKLGVRPEECSAHIIGEHGPKNSAMRRGLGWGMSSVRGYSTKAKLLHPRHEKYTDVKDKVTVVGVGSVGMATIFALLTLNVSSNIVMVDVNEDRVTGEMMDLQHATSFMYDGNTRIQCSTDYSKSNDSSICIIAAGVRQKVGEDRRSLVQRNVDVLKNIIPALVKQSPKTIIIVASNPVDVLTYVSWKLSGLEKNRVVGAGTNLDSGRFRFLLSGKLGLAPYACHGYIIGEHGDSSVPVWSGVNVAGVRLQELNPGIGKEGDTEDWQAIHAEVVQSAYTIIKYKGYTSWGIALSLAQIVRAILTNTTSVHPVSTCVQGEYGVKDNVFLSLPCVLGRSGVLDVVRLLLSDQEKQKFLKSATIMAELQATIKL